VLLEPSGRRSKCGTSRVACDRSAGTGGGRPEGRVRPVRPSRPRAAAKRVPSEVSLVLLELGPGDVGLVVPGRQWPRGTAPDHLPAPSQRGSAMRRPTLYLSHYLIDQRLAGASELTCLLLTARARNRPPRPGPKCVVTRPASPWGSSRTTTIRVTPKPSM
jgi:hypothetical protein